VVTQDNPLNARARVGGLQFEAAAEPEPPYLRGRRRWFRRRPASAMSAVHREPEAPR
jgi:hypothetical protein